MGLIDRFRRRGEDLSDESPIDRGYQARSSEIRKAERKEKIISGLKTLKKAGEDTGKGAIKVQGWLQEQHDKQNPPPQKRRSSGTRGKKKGSKKRKSTKRQPSPRAQRPKSLAEEMGLGGIGSSSGGSFDMGFGDSGTRGKKKKGSGGIELL